MAFGVLVAENCCLEEVVGAGVGGTEQWAGAELAEVELFAGLDAGDCDVVGVGACALISVCAAGVRCTVPVTGE